VLALVQGKWSETLNYKELTKDLMTLKIPDLKGLLTEGFWFTETILGWLGRPSTDLYRHTTHRERILLRIHVGKTLTKLRELRSSCGKRASTNHRSNVNFADVVSSYIKYKVYLEVYLRAAL
jgi:hypothetical protein